MKTKADAYRVAGRAIGIKKMRSEQLTGIFLNPEEVWEGTFNFAGCAIDNDYDCDLAERHLFIAGCVLPLYAGCSSQEKYTGESLARITDREAYHIRFYLEYFQAEEVVVPPHEISAFVGRVQTHAVGFVARYWPMISALAEDLYIEEAIVGEELDEIFEALDPRPQQDEIAMLASAGSNIFLREKTNET
jgi:hypothetical protein